MLSKWFASNKATIGSKSNGNLILQNNKIDNLVVCTQPSDVIEAYGASGNYDAVQKIIREMMSAAKRTHPLPELFSVQFDNNLERLISTPETAEALEKYPKNIECSVRLDRKKFPHMDKSETPWDYAYRTQTPISLETTAYQEFLGDVVDPFPVVEYSDGMITTIVPPPFPPAIDVNLVSGDICISITLQRKPCLEFGQMIFETISDDCGFSLRLTEFTSPKKINFTLTSIPGQPLFVQLQRERLLCAIQQTKHLAIMHDNVSIVNVNFKEADLSAEIFKDAPFWQQYLLNLQTIEEYTGCIFDMSDQNPITSASYRTAFVLASSLRDQWHCVELNFDDDVRCDADNLPVDIAENAASVTDKIITGEVLHIPLQGLHFRAKKYTLVYRDACINNIKSVEKNRKKGKKNILLTFRPLSGKTRFQKYYKFEGIETLPST